MASFIMIHPTVKSQYTQRHRQDMTGQDKQDNGPIAYGEPFYKPSSKNGNKVTGQCAKTMCVNRQLARNNHRNNNNVRIYAALNKLNKVL